MRQVFCPCSAPASTQEGEGGVRKRCRPQGGESCWPEAAGAVLPKAWPAGLPREAPTVLRCSCEVVVLAGRGGEAGSPGTAEVGGVPYIYYQMPGVPAPSPGPPRDVKSSLHGVDSEREPGSQAATACLRSGPAAPLCSKSVESGACCALERPRARSHAVGGSRRLSQTGTMCQHTGG